MNLPTDPDAKPLPPWPDWDWPEHLSWEEWQEREHVLLHVKPVGYDQVRQRLRDLMRLWDYRKASRGRDRIR